MYFSYRRGTRSNSVIRWAKARLDRFTVSRVLRDQRLLPRVPYSRVLL